jgi:hypothetical protein
LVRLPIFLKACHRWRLEQVCSFKYWICIQDT